jgi:catechol 2,3-dioxygenase-like lactoylglutathione lyase family enzyme
MHDVDAITMFVTDTRVSKEFYERAFDVSPIFEDENSVAFAFGGLIVNLLAEREAHSLIAPASVGARDAGSRFQLTIGVDDTNAACAMLADRGVELVNGPIDRAWGLRTACFADPDGHIWEFAAKIPDAG